MAILMDSGIQRSWPAVRNHPNSENKSPTTKFGETATTIEGLQSTAKRKYGQFPPSPPGKSGLKGEPEPKNIRLEGSEQIQHDPRLHAQHVQNPETFKRANQYLVLQPKRS